MFPNGHRNFRLCVLFASAFTTAIVSAETPANRVDSSRADSTLPGYSLARSGDREDFDFLVGEWTTVQRRLIARGVGSKLDGRIHSYAASEAMRKKIGLTRSPWNNTGNGLLLLGIIVFATGALARNVPRSNRRTLGSWRAVVRATGQWRTRRLRPLSSTR